MQEVSHSLTIEQQKSVAVTGVEAVLSFSETQITLLIGGLGKLYITGTGMKISGFSKSSGTFTAIGAIAGARYGGKSLRAKIFR